MSNNIDQRIVEMQFDNAQFERNVATSVKSLDTLEKSLKLDKASKGLENIQKASDKLSLSHISAGVDAIANKFSALGVLGVTMLQRISNAAITTGKNIVSALTIDPLKTGFREYETQINAIQTILSNTRSKGTTIDDVNKALDELNTYADKTIYNFTEMTRNIGTFTAAGIDLDKSTAAIKGIANLAAVSGSNAQQASTAMYQLSQALSTGTVRLMDWNSVVNAGMGGEVFQNALKETARVHKVNIDAIIKKQGSFRESLQEGWLTSEILLETLKKFTGDLSKEQILSMGYTEEQAKEILALGKDASDAATKVKTFTQLIDTLKEALGSGWTQTWENIFGNFEEARTLWTSISDALSNVIGKSAEARNTLLSKWKDAGGRTDLIEGLTDVFQSLWSIVVAVGDAMEDIFPKTTVDDLLSISSGVKKFGAYLHRVLYYKELLIGQNTSLWTGFDQPDGTATPGGFVSDLLRGAKGEAVKQMQRQLQAQGFSVGKAGIDGIFGPDTQAALKKYQKEKGLSVTGIFDKDSFVSLLGLPNPSDKGNNVWANAGDSILTFSEALDKVRRIASGAFAVIHIGVQVFTFLWNVVKHVAVLLSPLANVFLTIAAAIGDAFVEFDDWLEKSGLFSDWLKNVKAFLAPFGAAVSKAGQAILKFFGFGDEAKETTDVINTFPKLWNKIVTSVKSLGVWDKLTAAFDKLKDAFKDLTPVFKEYYDKAKAYLGEKFTSFLGKVAEAVPKIIESIGNAFVWLLDFITPFISKIPAAVKKVKDFLTTLLFDKTDENGNKTPGLFTRMGELFSNVWNWIKTSEVLQKAWDKVKTFFSNLWTGLFDRTDNNGNKVKGTFTEIKEFFTELYNSLKNSKFISTAWKKISPILKSAWDGLKEFFGAIGTLLNVFVTGDESGSGSGAKKESLKTIFEPFKRVGGWIKTSFSWVWDFLSNVFALVNKTLNSISPLAAIGIGTGLLLIFSIVKVLRAMKGMFNGLGEIAKAYRYSKFGPDQIERKSTAFLKIIAGIGLLVAAIYVLGNMDSDKLKQGLGVLGGMIAGLVVLTILASVLTKKGRSDGISSIAKGILNLAIGIGILAAAVYAFGSMDDDVRRQGFKSIIQLLVTLGIFLAIMRGLKVSAIEYSGLVQMAIAIGILALVARMIGGMNQEKFSDGLAGLTGIMGLLAVFMFAVNKLGGKARVSYKGLFAAALAIGIVALIARMIGGMDQEKFWRGFDGVRAIALGLLVFMAVVNRVGGSSNVKYKGLIGLSIAIALLAGVAILLGKTNKTALWRGVGAVGALAAIIGGLAVVLGTVGKGVQLGATLALTLGLAAVIVAFGLVIDLIRDVDPDLIGTFAVSLVGSLLALVAALTILGKPGGVKTAATGAAAISAAVAILVGSAVAFVTALGAINDASNDGLVEKLESGGEVLQAVGEAIGLLLSGIKTGFYGLTDDSSLSAEDLNAYAGKLDSYALGFGLVIGSLIVISTVLGRVPGLSLGIIKGAGALTIAMTELAAGLVGVVWSLGKINEKSGHNFEREIRSGGSVLLAIKDAVSGLFGNLEDAFAVLSGLFAASLVSGVTEGWPVVLGAAAFDLALGLLVYGITGIIASLGGINTATENGLVEDLLSGADVLAALRVALDSFSGKISSKEYLESVQNFTDAINAFSETTDGLSKDPTVIPNADKAMEIARKVHEFFSTLPAYDLDYGALPGYNTAAAQLSTDMGKFGWAIKVFSEGVRNLGDPNKLKLDTQLAIDIATMVHGFFVKLAATTIDQTNLKTYNTATEGLSENMGTLATAISDFKEKVSGIAKSGLTLDTWFAIFNLNAIANFLADLKDVPIEDNKSAIDKFFTGRTTKLDTVFEKILELSNAVASISASFGAVGEGFDTKAETVKTALKTLVGFLSYISGEESGYIDWAKLTDTTEGLNYLADGLQSFGVKTNNFDIGKFIALSGAFRTLITAVLDMEKISTQDVGTLITDTLNGISAALSSSDLEGLTQNAEAFATAGQAVGSSINTGLGSVSAAPGVRNIMESALSAAMSFVERFRTTGYNLGLGLKSGLERSKDLAIQAAKLVAQAMLKKTREVFDTQSPSKKFEEIGMYNDMGLANGTKKYAYLVTKASEKVGNNALTSTSRILSNLSTLVNDDFNADPVIRPVVDMSNVTSGARSITGMLSGTRSLTVEATRTKALASSISVTPKREYQNGTASENQVAGSEGNNTLNLSGNNFYIREKQDIYDLASEFAILMNQGKQAYGAKA